MPVLKVAVLSDLHFFLKEEANSSAESHLPVDGQGRIIASKSGVNKNPIDDLYALIARENLQVDLVLCPGDITTRADGVALKAAWASLVEIAKQLRAPLMCAATGNHDVSSRSQKPTVDKNPIRGMAQAMGPLEALKLLDPLYPVVCLDESLAAIEHRTRQGRYFGESFLVVDHDPRYRLLIFNSCSEHGHDPHEYDRGTAPQSSLRWMQEDMAALSGTKINLAIVHHPPLSQSTRDGDSFSFLSRGDVFLKSLEAPSDPWLVINGHKHHGELKRAQTHSNVPITVFSAASFSAANEVLTEGGENQFYVLDLSLDGGELRGCVKAWNWNVGSQWQPAPPRKADGIHDDCGFGSSRTPKDIATEIARNFSQGVTSWPEMRSAVPDMPYLMPDAIRAVIRCLAAEHDLIVEPDQLNFHCTLARRKR